MSGVTTDTGTFALIPTWVIDLMGTGQLNAGDIALYVLLAKHADNQSRDCYPRRSVLAKTMGCSPSSITRHIKRLKDAGAISVQESYREDNSQRANTYVLHRCKPECTPLRNIAQPPLRKNEQPSTRLITQPDSETSKSRSTHTLPTGVGGAQPEPSRTLRLQEGSEEKAALKAALHSVSCTSDPDGAFNRATKELYELGATPEDVYAFARLSDVDTENHNPMYVVHHWAEVMAAA